VELAQDAAHVRLDGRLGDDQPLGDGRVARALGHQPDDLVLARGQRGGRRRVGAIRRRARAGDGRERGAVDQRRDGGGEGAQQLAVEDVERRAGAAVGVQEREHAVAVHERGDDEGRRAGDPGERAEDARVGGGVGDQRGRARRDDLGLQRALGQPRADGPGQAQEVGADLRVVVVGHPGGRERVVLDEHQQAVLEAERRARLPGHAHEQLGQGQRRQPAARALDGGEALGDGIPDYSLVGAHWASARSPSGIPAGVGTSGVSRRYHSASSAAWQPEPAAVTAWR
jgi:hypothetical protein